MKKPVAQRRSPGESDREAASILSGMQQTAVKRQRVGEHEEIRQYHNSSSEDVEASRRM